MTHDEILNSLKAKKVFKIHLSGWKMLALLGSRSFVPWDNIYTALWPEPDLEPGSPERAAQKYLHLVRAQLEPYGITVLNSHGKGNYIPRAQQVTLHGLIQKFENS